MPDKRVLVSRRPGRERHGWVFSNEVRRTEGEPGTGETVLVLDRGRLVGSGLYKANSLICVRLYSDKAEELDERLLAERLAAAERYRAARLPGETDYRLCYGESDGLPGLVIDRYGPCCVVQAYSAGFDQRLGLVASVLAERFGAVGVYEQDDFRLRDVEGVPRRSGLLAGRLPDGLAIAEAGARFVVDVAGGQKTGFYFDQRVTRSRCRARARGRRVLDVCCYSGGFAVNAALGGAERVRAVDSSAPALELARANAALNGVGDRCEFVAADAFDFLADARPEFDLVCLDPPSFAPGARERMRGLRGFRKLNALALGALAPGGVLVTCSCSHHLSWSDLAGALAAAASDAGRDLVVLETVTQGPDHPVLLAMPETEYLRCFVLQAK